jgi:hypothetical protein
MVGGGAEAGGSRSAARPAASFQQRCASASDTSASASTSCASRPAAPPRPAPAAVQAPAAPAAPGPAPDAAAFGLGHMGFGQGGQAVAAPGVDGGFDPSGGAMAIITGPRRSSSRAVAGEIPRGARWRPRWPPRPPPGHRPRRRQSGRPCGRSARDRATAVADRPVLHHGCARLQRGVRPSVCGTAAGCSSAVARRPGHQGDQVRRGARCAATFSASVAAPRGSCPSFRIEAFAMRPPATRDRMIAAGALKTG